jgi:outer membrane protein TolC
MAIKNNEKAEENLRFATLSFKEGIVSSTSVLEAHTAWLSAQTEMIDAQVEMSIAESNYKKSMGLLK